MTCISYTVGRKIATARRLAGYTQHDIAERMQILNFAWSRSTHRRVENGGRPITLDELAAVALILDIPPIHLLPPEWTAAA